VSAKSLAFLNRTLNEFSNSMDAPSLTARIRRHWNDLGELIRLPLAHLHFDTGADRAALMRIYRYFTKPHARYRVVPNKAIGVALIDLRRFSTRAEYLDSVKGKGNAGPQSRRATARGYYLRPIDRNEFIDEIHDINLSCEFRQGRPMDAAYREKVLHFQDKPYVLYYGLFNKEGDLVAYCNVGLYGNFAGTEQVLGYRNSDGIMYLLFAEVIGRLIETRQCAFFMYDTFFGARDGLRTFKRRIGFRPYRARYTID